MVLRTHQAGLQACLHAVEESGVEAACSAIEYALQKIPQTGPSTSNRALFGLSAVISQEAGCSWNYGSDPTLIHLLQRREVFKNGSSRPIEVLISDCYAYETWGKCSR
jgi:hypothetical protein